MKQMTYEQWVEKALSDGWRPPLHASVTKEQVSEHIGEEAFLIEDYGKKYWITRSGKVISAAFGRLRTLKPNKGAGVTYPFHSLGNGDNLYLHRVLAQMFIDNPLELPYVNHKDGDKHNYSLDNLEWCTASENTIHAISNGLRRQARGTDYPQARFNESDVRSIRNRIAAGERVTDLARSYGVAHSLISAIKNGRSWSHVA